MASDWVDVALSWGHVCARKSTGGLFCAGRNDVGQLGDPARSDPDWTLKQLGVDTWTAVAADGQVSCAVRSDKSLWCWGDGRYGQLGNGLVSNSLVATLPQNTPLQVGTDMNWSDVHISTRTTYAMRTTGRVECLGHFIDGADGRGDAWSAVPGLVFKP
jgi:alpha-tubulin suppressor-like RCC1 family protein